MKSKKIKTGFCLFILAMITYSYKIFTNTISIDTERILNSPQMIQYEWITLNRFGLVFMKKIFSLVNYNLFLTNFFAICIYIFAIFMWLKIFENKFEKNSEFANFIFGAIIITSPILVEQYHFSLQCLEIAIAFLLMPVSFLCIDKYMKSKKIKYFIVSEILAIFVFSCYQAFIILFLEMAMFISIISYKENKKLYLEYLKMFFIAICAYIGINTIIKTFVVVKENEKYFQIFMQNNLLYSIIYIIYIMLGCDMYSNLLLIPLSIIFILQIKKEWSIKNNIIIYLEVFMFLLLPFSLMLITGTNDVARSRFSYVYLLASLMYYIILKNEKMRKYIFQIIGLAIIFIQAAISIYILYNDYIRYKEDVDLATQIMSEVGENRKIIFLGSYKTQNVKLKGEVLGYSFFEWDYNTEYGINKRANGFLKVLGYNYELPNVEEILEYKKKYNDFKISSEYEIIEENSISIVKFK